MLLLYCSFAFFTTGDSSVTFAARAFKDPFVYLYSEETSNSLDEYETYLRGFTEVNPGFKVKKLNYI